MSFQQINCKVLALSSPHSYRLLDPIYHINRLLTSFLSMSMHIDQLKSIQLVTSSALVNPIKIMKILNPKFQVFIILMIILAINQQSSCRYLHRMVGTEETKKTAATEIFTRHFPAEAPQRSRKEVANSAYGVSYRTVPGGPNPLHN